jgi:hypothetical protein
MRMVSVRTLGGIALAVALSATSAFAVGYSEAGDGDLSGDRLNPTNLPLGPGSNKIDATSINGDREYVHVILPAGLSLSSVLLESYTGGDDVAFIAVQAGSTFTESHTGTNVTNLLGYTHFGPSVDGLTDYLDNMGEGASAQGFTPPLTGSDYTFWIQQTGANASSYTFDFVVTPEPGSFAIASLGLFVLTAVRQRRLR